MLRKIDFTVYEIEINFRKKCAYTVDRCFLIESCAKEHYVVITVEKVFNV